MSDKSKRALLCMEEAAGKRIRRLSLSEPYPKSRDVYLTIEFEDETEMVIEVGCVPCFRITNLNRDEHGELVPVNESLRGSIRSLVRSAR